MPTANLILVNLGHVPDQQIPIEDGRIASPVISSNDFSRNLTQERKQLGTIDLAKSQNDLASLLIA